MTKASGNQQLCDENENKKGKAALNGDIGEHDEAAELQWRSMVSALDAEGRLDNCIAVCGLTGTTSDTSITAGSKSTSPTVLGTVGFKSLVIAGSSPPVPEPLVMCTHHRRFVSGTVGDGDINTAG